VPPLPFTTDVGAEDLGTCEKNLVLLVKSRAVALHKTVGKLAEVDVMVGGARTMWNSPIEEEEYTPQCRNTMNAPVIPNERN